MVQRLTLDLSIPDLTPAWDIQNRLSQLCNVRLGRIMDRVIHDVAQTGRHLRIDRMEIDLKELSSHRMEEEFQEKFEQEFSELLKQHISEALLKESWKEEIPNRPDRTFLRHPGSAPLPEKNHFLSHDDHWMAVLQFFLETGTLPWFAKRLQAETLEITITRLVDEQPDKTRPFFQNQLKKSTSRRRFILQFEWNLLKKIILLVATRKPLFMSEDLDYYLEAIAKTAPLFFSRTSVGELFWEAAVETAMEGTPGEKFFEKLLLKTVHGLSPDGISQKIRIFNAIEREVVSASAKDKVLQRRLLSPFSPVRKNIPPDVGAGGDAEFLEREAPASRPNSNKRLTHPGPAEDKHLYKTRAEELHPMDPVPGSNPFSPGKKDRLQVIGETTELHEPALDSIYVENAGLVIIWPYLDRLFETIGFTKEGRFLTEAQRAKAVLLLQYMASGEEAVPEFYLPLNKLLCGWDLTTPIQKKITIPDQARQESQILIKTLIKHWAALKSTSPKTFQTSFIQRKGILEKIDRNWRLRVERKPYDMLLERLPWSISMIRLSWMTTILQVEW